jgi:hypothetical protein
MGLVNMVAGELMEIVFTNIQLKPQQLFRLAAKIIATEARKHRKEHRNIPLNENRNANAKVYRLVLF